MVHLVRARFAIILLSVGIAITFVYAAISSFLNPEAWIGFLPGFLRDTPFAGMLLNLFSVFEIFLGLWLISGIKTSLAAIVSLAVLVVIIISSPGAFLITFRDVAIAFAAAALAVLARH